MVAQPEAFAGRLCSAGKLQQFFEQLIREFVHRHTLEQLACVPIHVVSHGVEQSGMAGDLDHGNRFAAEAASAAGGEQHQVATAGDLACDAGRIKARRVHHVQTLLGHRVRVVQDTIEDPSSGLADCPE